MTTRSRPTVPLVINKLAVVESRGSLRSHYSFTSLRYMHTLPDFGSCRYALYIDYNHCIHPVDSLWEKLNWDCDTETRRLGGDQRFPSNPTPRSNPSWRHVANNFFTSPMVDSKKVKSPQEFASQYIIFLLPSFIPTSCLQPTSWWVVSPPEVWYFLSHSSC